jgi:hypothetical protein
MGYVKQIWLHKSVNEPPYLTKVLTVRVRIPVAGIEPPLLITASYSLLSLLHIRNGGFVSLGKAAAT